MVDDLKQMTTGKRVLILGFGMEGQSTYSLLRRLHPDMPLTIADKDSDLENRIRHFTADKLLNIIPGNQYLDQLPAFDLIFKSPGIPVSRLRSKIPGAMITSQTDLVLRYYSKQVIGVTGTKGKSTTASLIYWILGLTTDNAVLVGNIGRPPFDFLDRINDQTVIIYELSSHQLESVTHSPHLAILLNLYQEHLDYYDTFEAYQMAKLNICKFQGSDDILIYNDDDPAIGRIMSGISLPGILYRFSIEKDVGKGCYLNSSGQIIFRNDKLEYVFEPGKLSLKGEHNLANILSVVTATLLTGLSEHVIREGLRTFKGLEHRLEYVGECGDIHFYNDSIATVPEATIHAIRTLKDTDTLILGGFDRGIDYSALADFLSRSSISNIIFFGKAGQRILDLLKAKDKTGKRYFTPESFAEGVTIAFAWTKPGKICLLSPAAASYDMFMDFEERGAIFKKLVCPPSG